MTQPTLLNVDSPHFSWAHAERHRVWIGAWEPDTRSQLSLVPYFIDPTTNSPRWRLVHQQAHWDSLDRHPPMSSYVGPFGAPVTQDLWQNTMATPDDKRRWTFMNHQEHYYAALDLAQKDANGTLQMYYPFW